MSGTAKKSVEFESKGANGKRTKPRPRAKIFVCSECMADFTRPQGVRWLNSFSFECPYCGGTVYEEDYK